MLSNILPCISLHTNKGRRACILVTHHVNMHHVRYGGELKSFPHKPNGIQLLDCLGGCVKQAVTASHYSNWGAPKFHCSAPHS